MSVVTRPGESGLGTETQGFAIVVEGLRKRYGSLVAVDGISLRVKEREIFGLLGPNGAGKTTTVEILEGLRSADEGQALVGGIDVRKDPQKVKNVIGVQLQSSAFFDGLNLMELLDLFAALYKRTVELTTVALQIVVLLAVGFFGFHFHFAGNLLYLLIVGIVGGGIFLAMGLAISGASKSEETAAPIANLVSLPLMFLSGIFFARSSMPEWLQTITQYSPLTYVSDALRSISVDGASLWAVRGDLLGIFIWLGITVVLATRLFKWEVV